MVVSYEEQVCIADTHIAEACRNDGILSSSHGQEHISSCGSPEVLVMNGSAEVDITDRLNSLDRVTSSLQVRSAGNTDTSTHISAVDESSASHDVLQSVSVTTDSSSLESRTVAQTHTDRVVIALSLSSSLPSQPAGISVADTAAETSPRDYQAVPVHEQLVNDTECMSSASMSAISLPRHRLDRHSVSSISSDTCASSINLGARTGSDILPDVVSISHSSEKLWSWPTRRERGGFDSQAVGVVRSSWSQENYFDDSDVTCVDIDLDDDDDLASSVDVLHYRDTTMSADAQTHSWTEDDVDHGEALSTGKLRSWAPLKGDEVFSELFSSDSESSLGDNDYSSSYAQFAASDYRKRAAKTYGVGVAIDFDLSDDSSGTVLSSSPTATGNSYRLTGWNGAHSSSSGSDTFDELYDDAVTFPPSVFTDIATRPSSKDVDRPSAARLAKRLYYLQGFRKSDISRHLTKKYDVICYTTF